MTVTNLNITAQEKTSGERLRSFLERVERMEEEKSALMEDIKVIWSEAKAEGYDTKIMKKIVRLRKMEQADRMEEESLLESYMAALGML